MTLNGKLKVSFWLLLALAVILICVKIGNHQEAAARIEKRNWFTQCQNDGYSLTDCSILWSM